MLTRWAVPVLLAVTLTAAACGSGEDPPEATGTAPATPLAARATTPPEPPEPAVQPKHAPAAAVPGRDPRSADVARPDRTVGDGTPGSCTSEAVVKAVAAGGVIVFSCGPDPMTITMTATAKVRNSSSQVVLDGGGLVTLSGGGSRRILYQNTCDQELGWTTSHCQDQATPRLTLQNIGFADGNSTGETAEGGGGGAVFVRGGRLKVAGVRFTGNRCDPSGPDLGGAALRVLSQYQGRAVGVSGSTFKDGVCSNGGAISGIGTSWRIEDSTFTGNRAIGSGANPSRPGTQGGGSGGAIYADGNLFTITVLRSRITGNSAREGGGAIFFVSNDRTGTLVLDHAKLSANPSKGFETRGYPGIFFIGAGVKVR
ncbi:hypothetical protein [Actinocorallia longicatena]|uniref:Outer membrane repeat protein n=1 Tax=Actinocorallia longicatena TaxID=111803 RepID=A0ABP6PYT1_9ACTN